MREISERHGFWVYLTSENHRGTYGVHGKCGHELDLRLKRICQRKFEEESTREVWMKIIGRNYLDDEEAVAETSAGTEGFFLLEDFLEDEGC